MKKSIFLIITLAFLNACAEYSALIGPSYTLAKSGSVVQTGSAYATSYGIKKTFGKSPGEYVLSIAKKSNKADSIIVKKVDSLMAKNDTITIRECETFHSSSLTEIFFDTLDEIDCLRDPFSILK